jgi:hypothetical protein
MDAGRWMLDAGYLASSIQYLDLAWIVGSTTSRDNTPALLFSPETSKKKTRDGTSH